MLNFKVYKIFVLLCILFVLLVSTVLLTGNDPKIKKYYNPDNIVGVIVGNSHANRILLNSNKIFYMNADGNIIKDYPKQIEYAKQHFKNLKFIIINITPVEMFATDYIHIKDNEFLYASTPKGYLDTFERAITTSPATFLTKLTSEIKHGIGINEGNNKESFHLEENNFSRNGRKIISGDVHKKVIDWIKPIHYEDTHFSPLNETYNNHIIKIKNILNNNKALKLAVISMPLNHRYTRHLSNVLKEHNLLNMASFVDDMTGLFGNCYINLIDYPLPDKYFYDGDHLNLDGAHYMKKIIHNRISQCLGDDSVIY